MLAIATTMFAVAFCTSSASAATYTVFSCKTPSGAVAASTAEWAWKGNSVSMKSGSSCPRGYHWMDLAPVRHLSAHASTLTYVAPADTELAGYVLTRSARTAPGSGFFYSVRELRADGEYERDGCVGCGDRGSWSNAGDPANRVARTDVRGVNAIKVVLGCSLAECPAAAPLTAQFQLHRAELSLRDDQVPEFTAAPSGPFVEPGATLTGIVPVSVSLSDRGGGVRALEVEVDGRVAQSAPLGGAACAPPYTVSVPCPPSAGVTVPVDTSGWSDGAHSVRLIARDATDENAAVWGPFTLRTRNAMCATQPAVREVRVTAGVRRRGAGAATRPRRTLRIGRRGRAVVTGRLRTREGQPIAGAPLCAVARGVGYRRTAVAVLGTAMTDARGGYRIRVPKGGASQRIAVVHRTASGANVARTRVNVPAPVSLRLPRSTGTYSPVRIRGRVPGLKRGATVSVQVRQPGRWQTFRSPKVDRRGRFAVGYTFRTPGTFRLRAKVDSQFLSPYATGGSPSRLITAR